MVVIPVLIEEVPPGDYCLFAGSFMDLMVSHLPDYSYLGVISPGLSCKKLPGLKGDLGGKCITVWE